MVNQAERDKKIFLLQQNLSSIRKIAGWTTEQLGERIGVSKQTISNLENNKSPMNFTQYIAIRSVLDCEIEENRENEILGKVVEILLDRSDELDENNYKKIKSGIDTVAAAAYGGIAGAALTGTFTGLLGPTLGALGIGLLGPAGLVGGAVAGVASSLWLKNILSKNK